MEMSISSSAPVLISLFIYNVDSSSMGANELVYTTGGELKNILQ